MEPVQLILAALAAGRDSSDAALVPAFTDLRARLLDSFGENARAVQALDDYLEDPGTYERPLAKALVETGAAENPSIQDRAALLLGSDRTQSPDILHQIAEREELRTGDRFTRMAHTISGLKAHEEAASRKRMEAYWDEEFERRDALAAQKARQRRQERRMLIGVVAIAALIVIVFLVIIVVTSQA